MRPKNQKTPGLMPFGLNIFDVNVICMRTGRLCERSKCLMANHVYGRIINRKTLFRCFHTNVPALNGCCVVKPYFNVSP